MPSPTGAQPGGQEWPGTNPADWLRNPQRTPALYRRTAEGYIIAEDMACQYEYATLHACCPACGGRLGVVAQIDRAADGLSELVCECRRCEQTARLHFDISNAAYQGWLAGLQGELYTRRYDGSPRTAAP